MSYMLMFVLGIIALHVQQGGGAAFLHLLEHELVHGRPIIYCLYGTMKLAINSTFFDIGSCLHCSCDHNGLYCFSGSSVILNQEKPSECKVIYVACEPIWVMNSNEAIDCPAHLIPEHSMIGK